MKRIRCRLTSSEREQLQTLAQVLALRPGQVATRLVEGELSGLPRQRHALWVELGHTANNLVQLQQHLDQAPDAGSAHGQDLRQQAAEVLGLVAEVRADLLGRGGT